MHNAIWKTTKATQSTVRSSQGTLKGKRKEFLPVFLKVQPSEAKAFYVFEGQLSKA
jgi:hypothetical protein